MRDEEKAATGTDSRGVDPLQITDQEAKAEGRFRKAVDAESDGKLFKAVELDMRALEADPEHAEASAHLAELRSKMPSAEELIRKGQDDYQQEDLEAALEQWRKALLIDPGNAQALEYVARAEQLLANLERLRAGPEVGAEEK
jgi:tetratricopeptide (TPR) repeat protein